MIIGLLSLLAFISSSNGQLVSKVESVGFTVSDMDRAIDFYTHVLPFEKASDREIAGEDLEQLSGVFGARARVVDLKLGDETLELTEYLTPQGRPVPLDSRSNDRWFQHIAIIVSDMDRAYAHLRANKVRHASTGPQELPAYITAAAGIRAFYFKDFDNHALEILSFPADKGLPKWHELAKTGKLFLGIDHTAIVIGNTETSLGFYRDILGLRVAGSSDNYGPEQEHLNNVKGAKLHITGLRTKEGGVAVEFLEYRNPTDGRAYPSDTRSNDLWYWQTSFAARNAADLPINSIFVSNGFVDLKGNLFAFQKGAVIRDPDGHAVRLVSVVRP
jgi:catechol 2,3-dioxygenase-like lactoylglutathione lyase family enzyme